MLLFSVTATSIERRITNRLYHVHSLVSMMDHQYANATYSNDQTAQITRVSWLLSLRELNVICKFKARRVFTLKLDLYWTV